MRDIEALAPVLDKEVERPLERWEPVERRERAADVSGNKDVSFQTPPAVNGREPTATVSERVAVAFQGEHGAYSESALLRFFSRIEPVSIPCETFGDVFKEVLVQRADYGIIPLENSLAGSIHENYDLLLQYPDIKIIGEQKIRIEHHLLGLPGACMEDIKRVISHPQGLAQCSVFLHRRPDWEQVPFYDTAGAAAYIAEQKDPSLAAIAGEKAAEVIWSAGP